MNVSILAPVALAAIVTMLVNILKPFVELLPFASPDAADQRTHDAALQALNLLLNVCVVVLATAAVGGLHAQNALALALQAVAQAAGSHVMYQVSSGSAAPAAVASAAPSAPLHQQESPAAPAVASDASAI
jgi:hypothetical protein